MTRCLACGHSVVRAPVVICRRCESKNVASREFEGWGDDDLEEAREDPGGGAWAYYDGEELRCLDCHITKVRAGASVRGMMSAALAVAAA